MDNSKNLMNNDKSLCLYCDKAFSNINDQGNHVERDHKTVLNKSKGSLRKSERITKNLCSENSPFAACFYCNNKKLIKSDDLESLFQHLLAAHKDIYFGCKCKTRLLDKVSLANHKKNCELGGGGGSSKLSDEKISEKRKSTKSSQATKGNVDSKCDTLSDSIVINATAASHSVKALPTNAINKKSDRSNVKNSNNKNVVNSNEKRNNNNNSNSNNNNNINNNNNNNSNHSKKGKISNSSSSSTISSSSSNKTLDEYTIPLTRQKLKEPTSTATSSSSSSTKQSSSQSRSTSNNKKALKNSRSSLSANENKNASSLHASTSFSSSSPTKVQRTKTTKIISHNSQNNTELVESTQKNEALSTEFEEDFYKNISHNIRVNLNSFIDGKVDRLQLSRPVFDRISTQENNKKHDKKEESNEIPNHDEKEIHEATNFELSTPFPALLTAEQYGFGDSNPKNKRQITKNSWKWKWDLIKKYKYVNEGGKIVKKVKQITTGLKDLSQLDMWTQLSMRSRYENLNNQNGTTSVFDDGLNDSLSTRMIKTQNIEQLNGILDKRSIPEINIEQLQQTLVKEEPIDAEEIAENNADEYEDESKKEEAEILGMFNLAKVDTTKTTSPALSGEWARPRCFVCIDCGQEFDLMKSLNDHKNSEHPYVVSAHYEIVGRENLEQKLYKNLFLPKKALHAKGNAKSLSINSDSKSNEASSSSENSSSNYLTDQKEKECSKCMKTIKYSNDIDVYRHILDCIEDRVWMQAKRRNKYRRSRRKTKKNVKKTRLSTDQKKNTSSPFRKENIEGDNSLSNPPTPKEDIIQKPIVAKAKTETYVNDEKSNKDGMNIKSFFRVSKTTPNLPQKIVVQMIEMHQNAHNNSLRHSLRSSAKKLSTTPQNSNAKNSSNTEETSSNSKMTESNENNSEESILKDETIMVEAKTDVENTKTDIVKTNIPPALTALQIPDSDKMKSLSSPTNSSTSSLVSPTSSVPKKKKKLNDCIAMLTCKIQEKLGVNFFENTTAEIFPTNDVTPNNKKQEESIINTTVCTPITLPSFPNLTITPVSIAKDNKKIPNVPPASFTLPEQDEVIDLSIKKKPCEEQVINVTISNATESQNSQTTKCEETKVDSSSIPICDELKEESISVKESAEPVESSLKDLEKCNKNENIQETVVEQPCAKDNEETIQEESESQKISDITESFKISIPKDRIPNLKEILETNSVTTVSKLKISDAERRAFEEQKNRIMQILNKSKKTTAKKPVVKKAAQKKQPAKKNAKQQQPKEAIQMEKDEEGKIESEPSKVPSEPVIESEEPKESKEKEEETKKEQESECIKTSIEPQKPIEQKKTTTKVLYKFPGSETPERQPEEQPIESKPIVEEKLPETVVDANIKNKIEQAIKSTNRIRCRRLSVVVDPIIHLSPFQQSNRKIRLTNNSQQNGLYDLLTNDQLFNAIKPQLKDEIKKTCAKVAGTKASKSIQNAINEVRAATTTAKTNQVKEQPEAVSTPKNVKSKVSAKANNNKKTAVAAQKSKNNKKNVKVNTRNSRAVLKKEVEKKIEKVLKNIKKTPVKSKPPAKSKKAPVAAPKPIVEQPQSIPELPPTIPQPQEPKIEEKEKPVKPSKAPAKKKGSKNNSKQKKNIVKESIVDNEKVEQKEKEAEKPETLTNEIENIIPVIVADEKLSLDISLSSDTSNENDIPLAKLVGLNKEKTTKDDEKLSKDNIIVEDVKMPEEHVEKEPIIEKIPLRSSNKKKAPAKKASKGKAQNKSRTKSQNNKASKAQIQDEVIINEDKLEELPENDVKIEELKLEAPLEKGEVDVIEKVEEINFEEERKKEIIEKPKKSVENKSKPSESISAKTKIEKENMEKMEVFNMNEDDSFFNDDNDADEKINDLVNNIINSSELIDSETEKNDQLKQNSNAEAKCLVCKRTFRNEKVLEKHNMTTTHLFKVKRREKRIADQKEKESKKEKEKVKEIEKDSQKQNENQASADETKIFRTKGALKTFENILTYPANRMTEAINYEQPKEFKPAVTPEHTTLIPFESDKKLDSFEYDDDDDKNEDLSRKDKIFDSLFSNIENKLQAAAAAASNTAPPLQKYTFPSLTPHDSEVESSSTSWDLKHDADIEWDADNNDNNQPAITNAIKEKYPKKSSIKINKSKETAISIPTKSLIMGKIFKKHRDREKQKTPQADAPNNKPGIKNSLDEIFDHLKNSAEIDDKVLTCPSPKTLLKSSGGTFSPHSSHSNDMLETASQSNNNNNSSSNNNTSNNINNNSYSKKPPTLTSTAQDKSSAASSNEKKTEVLPKNDNKINDDEEDGIGKRKSRRRCAIKAKTFAETWSSDEYEELHDTNDIISIINEIEKRESIKKRKVSKSESHFVDNNVSKKSENVEISTTSENNHQNHKPILKSNETVVAEKKSTQQNDKKKSVQLQFPTSDIFSKEKEKPVNTIRKRRMSTLKDGHKSDEETFTATKDLKPLKPTISMMKKRRMSCFVPSSIFNDSPKPQANSKTVKNNSASSTATITTEVLSKVIAHKIDKEVEHKEGLSDASEKCGKNQKKILNTVCNSSNSSATAATKAKKVQKHRKRPRNKVKNIAYDSDSDFELNLSRKSKASAFSDSYSETEEDGDEISHTNKTNTTSQNALTNLKSSNTNELTMIKEPKLLPNDLNVVPTTTPAKAAIPEDINDPTQSACNRTKRHSSEKLYYWSSSSESDVEPGDTADGENEDSMIPQQPEQHGWIVGDSHKKLVTLLAHAKIKNKIN